MSDQFRKKPVAVNAYEWQGDVFAAMRWAEAFGGSAQWDFRDGELFIKTLEGEHHASRGDFIIRGVKGEFYPCKPDIFAATYEPAAAPLPETPPRGTTPMLEVLGVSEQNVAKWVNTTLASMLVAFSDDHPDKKVQEAMVEAAKRLRAAPAAPTATTPPHTGDVTP